MLPRKSHRRMFPKLLVEFDGGFTMTRRYRLKDIKEPYIRRKAELKRQSLSPKPVLPWLLELVLEDIDKSPVTTKIRRITIGGK